MREDLAAEQREYTTLAFYIHACVLKKADETNEWFKSVGRRFIDYSLVAPSLQSCDWTWFALARCKVRDVAVPETLPRSPPTAFFNVRKRCRGWKREKWKTQKLPFANAKAMAAAVWPRWNRFESTMSRRCVLSVSRHVFLFWSSPNLVAEELFALHMQLQLHTHVDKVLLKL